MKANFSTIGMLALLAFSGATSYANSLGGQITCANDNSPIFGVKVTITGGNNCQVAPASTEFTDSQGNFIFYLGGCSGTFTICIDTTTLPPGTTLVGPSCIDTNIQDTSETLNFSVNCQPPPPTGHVRGTVFCDANANGVLDAGESGIPGVTVTLCDGQTRITDANGNYSFDYAPPVVPCAVTVDATTVTGSCNLGGCATTIMLQPNGPAPNSFPNYDNINFCFIPPQPPVAHGDTATIGFWHNKNGQALINSLNGGSTSTTLGTWLANNYGCLFGNLSGKSNAAVAAQFLTYFNVTGAKTYAQIMAGALADYVTSSTLAGGTMAAGYGFTVSAAGTGAKTYNVGSNGTAIGLLNNTSYTVAQLLQAANANCSGGVFSLAAFNALNNIFDGINQSGDIN